MEKELYDGIIFDLDGTLWDSTDVNKRAWDIAYENMTGKKSQVDDELFKSCMGLLIPDIAKKIHPELNEQEIEKFVELAIDKEHEMLGRTGGILYPRFYETLEELSKKHKLCIVSNCQAGYIEIFLECHKCSYLFSDFECPGNTGLAKDENIKLVAKRNGFDNPIYVGDTIKDMNSAHNANLPFVWASYGFGKDITGYEYKVACLYDLVDLLN